MTDRCPTCHSEQPDLCAHSRFICQHIWVDGCCPDDWHGSVEKAGGGRERAGDSRDAAPDTRAESAATRAGLPQDAGSTPARQPSERSTYCEFCFSERPSRRLLVHKGDCLLNVAWDVEDTYCTCHSGYRCRSKWHKVTPTAREETRG